MNRTRRRVGRAMHIGLTAGIAGLCLLAGPAILPADAAHPLVGDDAEQAVLGALKKKKFIRAREKAEAILQRRPRSLLARYALAEVFFEEEANLPRALYHMRSAEKMLLERFGQRPKEELAQRWHRKLLLRQEEILGEMDRRHEQLALLDRYDGLYQPKQDHRRIWPLMKLHRFSEARRIARKLTLSSRQRTRVSGYNGLLSVEFERERPRACFEVAMEAVKATGYRSCVLALNTAEAAFSVFQFDEVERLAQKSLQAPEKDCPASAHQHLANLYLLRADFQRAISAVKAARAAGVQRRHRQQFENTLNAWLMRLLYALGRFDKALELASRVVRAPDRMGLTSFSAELMELIHTVDHHATLQAEAERLREWASARPLFSRIGANLTIAKLRLSAWRTRHKAAKLLASGDMLRGLLRPYLKPLPPWSIPTLIDVVGEGVMRQGLALTAARVEMKSETAPYFAAWRAEIAYREGNNQEALRLARDVLTSLPKDEVLMRTRVMAWSADAARRLGDAKSAQAYFDATLDRWPTALRLLGIQLPCKIVAGKGQLARAVADRLRGSRRLRPGNIGFAAHTEQEGTVVRVCLTGPRGRRYACGVADTAKTTGDAEDKVAAVIDAFHAEVFAPKVDLTQGDINSLDGMAVRGRADQVLKDILGK